MRGGADVGPITQDLAVGLGKTVAGITVGGALLEKYAGLGSTTLVSTASGDLFTTNAVIAACTYCTSCLTSSFSTIEVVASLWIASVALKFKDSGVNEDSLKSNVAELAVAAVMGVIAFVE